MTALPLADFTAAQKTALERMEAAEPAKEGLRERVAAALWESLPVSGHDRRPWPLLTMADAAIDVLRGPSTCTTCGEAQAAVERALALADELDEEAGQWEAQGAANDATGFPATGDLQRENAAEQRLYVTHLRAALAGEQ